MKTVRTKGIAVLVAALLACSLTSLFGCGGGGAGDKITVTVAMLNTEKKSFEALEKGYEALHGDVDIRIVTYTAYETQMSNYVKNKNWADIVWTAGDQHAGYSGAGHFFDLRQFADDDPDFSFETSGIYPVLLEATHYGAGDDGYWFMPRDYNIPTIFVNKKHLQKAGIDFEALKANWNYDKFLETCAALKSAYAAADSSNDNIRDGFLSSAYPLELDAVKMSNFTGILASLGGKMIDPSASDYDGICAFRTPASKEAYKRFYETFYENEYVDPTDTTGSLFNKKQAGMWLAVRPEAASVPATVEYDFLPNPFPYSGVGCGGYAITKAADRTRNGKRVVDVCWDILKYTVSDEGQNLLSASGLLVPSVQSLKTTGVWTTWGDKSGASRNHTAFTDYAGTLLGLNDIKVFAPSYNASVDKELVSLVTHCIQFKGGDFASAFDEKTTEAYNRIQGFPLANK